MSRKRAPQDTSAKGTKKPKEKKQSWAALLNDCKSISGTLKLDEPVTVYCQKDKKVAETITFPPNKEGIETLIAASQPAVFGRENQNVLDTTYRKAKAIGPEVFATNFVPPLSLLRLVRNAFVPTDEIEARLYKLNVYGEKDFFKPHVDTTRGVTMFGSLVVSLPCEFEGGELVVGLDAKYSLCSTSAKELRWVAFISDTPHEVLPITKGHRITLTYNLHRAPLYHILETLGPSVKETAIYRALREYKESHPDHAWLAFNCQHSYTKEQLIEAVKAPLEILRGSDLRLALAVNAIGGKFSIIGLYNRTVGAEIKQKVEIAMLGEDETHTKTLRKKDKPPFLYSFDHVDKRKGGNQILGAVIGSYGNSYEMDAVYFSAVMTVKLTNSIPPAPEIEGYSDFDSDNWENDDDDDVDEEDEDSDYNGN